MRIRLNNHRAASLVEYIVLAMLILGALYTMNDKLMAGLGAKYKSMGDSFGFGRQFDAKRTVACKQDVEIDDEGNPETDNNGVPRLTGQWYDENCYQTRVMRKPEVDTTDDDGHVTWDEDGGCPQCFPGDVDCFKCEDDIKESCESDYCNSNN